MSPDSGGATASGPPAHLNGVGLRLIVGYKFIKASAEFLFAALLLGLDTTGFAAALRAAALGIQHHTTAAWSIVLARWLVQAATRRTLIVIALAAFLDGVLSAVEGWALHRRYGWSRWLVVGSTLSLIPFEAIELVRRVSLGRVALLVVNVLIVGYLLRHRMGLNQTPAVSGSG